MEQRKTRKLFPVLLAFAVAMCAALAFALPASAFADGDNNAYVVVQVKNGADGETEVVKSYTKAQFEALASTDTTPVSGMYEKSGKRVVTAKTYVKFSDLFNDAGLSTLYTNGCYVGFGDDSNPTGTKKGNSNRVSYADLNSGVFYPNDTATTHSTEGAYKVEPVLALTSYTGTIGEGQTAKQCEEANLASADATNAPMSVMGVPEGKTAADWAGIHYWSGTKYVTLTVPTFTELAGDTRYDTSAISLQQAMAGLGTDNAYKGVIVATGENYADALAASGLSGLCNYPILLANPEGLDVSTAKVLASLQSACADLDIIVVGGTEALPQSVEDELAAYDGNKKINRLFGDTRYDTAKAIYDYGATVGDGWSTDYAVVATGENYADALSAASYAAKSVSPVLLVEGTSDTASDWVLAAAAKVNDALYVGGKAAISEGIERAITSKVTSGAKTERFAGDTRYDTSAKFAAWAVSDDGAGMSVSKAGLATGANFADALSATALLSQRNAVLLLVDPLSINNASTLDFLAKNAQGITDLTQFGGEAALDFSARAQLASSNGLGWLSSKTITVTLS